MKENSSIILRGSIALILGILTAWLIDANSQMWTIVVFVPVLLVIGNLIFSKR